MMRDIEHGGLVKEPPFYHSGQIQGYNWKWWPEESVFIDATERRRQDLV